MSRLSEITGTRELLANLTLRELRSKYKRSLLGWAWSLLNPLATMLIFTVVFRTFLKVRVPEGDPSGLDIFALWLLCGLLPWTFLANGMTGSMGALISNANLIKKVYFPREVLVVANVASWLVSFVIELGVLLIALQIAGNFVFPWLVPVLVVVAIQSAFVVGMGLVLSALNVYFRDVQHFVAILLQLWFYASPIVYPLDVVPREATLLGRVVPVRSLYELNPVARFIEAYRDAVYDLRFPPLADIAYLVVVSAGVLALGLAVFTKLEPKLAEEL